MESFLLRAKSKKTPSLLSLDVKVPQPVKCEQHKYTIGGVPLQFPCKPYPTQIQMMSKLDFAVCNSKYPASVQIIQALNKEGNALLESPTGSGKSLALLCSALAWQQQQQSTIAATQLTTPLYDGADAVPVVKIETVDTSGPSAVKSEEDAKQPVVNGTTATEHGAMPSSSEDSKPIKTEESQQSNVPVAKKRKYRGRGKPVMYEDDPDTPVVHSAVMEQQMETNGKTPEVVSSQLPTPAAIASGPIDFTSIATSDQIPTDQMNTVPTDQMNTVPTDQMNTVPTDQMNTVPTDQMNTVPTDQMNTVPTDQMNTVPTDQMNTVPTDQLNAVSTTVTSDQMSTIASVTVSGEIKIEPTGTINPPASTANDSTVSAGPAYRRTQIYFGTRTHKQITQLVHELRKTAYADARMTILSSREHTCIHPNVSKMRNKNEECRKLVKYKEGVSCSYFHKVQQRLGSQAKLKEYGFNTAWDIEDFVGLGNAIKVCPYYAARTLKEEADIIFCPYNYLIDPLIRSQMLIDVTGQVIILDEAHNMEDSAREAASGSVTSRELEEIVKEMEELYKFCFGMKDLQELRDSLGFLKAVVQQLVTWMQTRSLELPQFRYEESCQIWNGRDFLPILRDIGVCAETYPLLKKHVVTVGEGGSTTTNDEKPTLSSSAMQILETTFVTSGYLFVQNMKFTDDYRVALKRTAMFMPQNAASGGGWKRRRPRHTEKEWVAVLHFWCLNPAVAFTQLQCARSVVLTSGTLSPMKSFASELGVEFPIQLEANHVIPLNQTWVSTISCGPNGRFINASYQHAETFEFQDELGQLLLKVCKTVPKGVLCFLSSYKLLEKLTLRWQDTGLWYQVTRRKHIVSEPRAGEKEDFESVMASFYEHVGGGAPSSEDDDEGGEHQDGALFLAVCRGKVSEGLDFSDDNARAVITVGIPFPNIKDKQVGLKREYNNELCYSRGLLSGGEWYEIQAYRALNQALGRCIRHKKDWGALILVDERFGKGMKYTKGLSKWVRQRVTHTPDFNGAMISLSSFVQSRIQESISSTDVSICDTSANPPCSGAVSTINPSSIPKLATPSKPFVYPTAFVKSPTTDLVFPGLSGSNPSSVASPLANSQAHNTFTCHTVPSPNEVICIGSTSKPVITLNESPDLVSCETVLIDTLASSLASIIPSSSVSCSSSGTLPIQPSSSFSFSAPKVLLQPAVEGTPTVSNTDQSTEQSNVEVDDNDVTPPLSPPKCLCVPTPVTTSASSTRTPRSKLRRSTRRRIPVTVTPTATGDNDDDDDFKTSLRTSVNRQRKRKHPKLELPIPLKMEDKVDTAVSTEASCVTVLCSCGKLLANVPDSSSWVTLSQLVSTDTPLQTSWLWLYFVDQKLTDHHVVCVSTMPATCTPRGGSKWSNNAVWDEAIKWCFQLLDCSSCGKMVGIKIFHAAGRPDLDNMILLISLQL